MQIYLRECKEYCKITKKWPYNKKLPKNEKIKIVPLYTKKSHFCKDKLRRNALEKKMQTHRVSDPND